LGLAAGNPLSASKLVGDGLTKYVKHAAAAAAAGIAEQAKRKLIISKCSGDITAMSARCQRKALPENIIKQENQFAGVESF
jgi:hypothetical protein